MALRRHFQSPRLLSLGDIIPVVLPPPRYPFWATEGEGDLLDDEGDDEDENEDQQDSIIEHKGQGEVVYFKVTRGTRVMRCFTS